MKKGLSNSESRAYQICFLCWIEEKDIREAYQLRDAPDQDVENFRKLKAKENLDKQEKSKLRTLENDFKVGRRLPRTINSLRLAMGKLVKKGYLEKKITKKSSPGRPSYLYRSTVQPFFDAISDWKVYSGLGSCEYTYGELESGKAEQEALKNHEEPMKLTGFSSKDRDVLDKKLISRKDLISDEREEFISFKKSLKTAFDDFVFRSFFDPMNLEQEILSMLEMFLEKKTEDNDLIASDRAFWSVASDLIESKKGLNGKSIGYMLSFLIHQNIMNSIKASSTEEKKAAP